MKILSFIVPSYNCEAYLNKCISSIADENVIDRLEVIIVNDGSSDKTEMIAREWCDRYPESIRLINQENKGHGGALNTGCAAATGKYLKVVDADDWVETQNLAEFLTKLDRADADVVLTQYYTRDILNGNVNQWRCCPADFDRKYTLNEVMSDWRTFENGFTLHGIAYRTDFYREKCIQLTERVFYEDYEFASVPACFAEDILVADVFVYDYRIGDVNQSVSNKNRLARVSHTEKVIERLVLQYRELASDVDPATRKYLCVKTKELLLSYMKTVMLDEPNHKKGRREGKRMMMRIGADMPETYALAEKQYTVLRLFNRLHISTQVLNRILQSRIYGLLKRSL